MAGDRAEVGTEAYPIFARVVGGELPLSPEEARPWLDEVGRGAEGTPVEDACRLYGGDAGHALWLPFGRSALGMALELAGMDEGAVIALPSYMCEAVFEKVRSGNWSLGFYHPGADLAPDENELLEMGRRVAAVVTCAYFGSQALDEKLMETGRRLLELPERPWVIEDRAMAFPAPVPEAEARARSDFIFYSLRKAYPVPDGAPLVACSERARKALAKWRERVPPALSGDSRRAIQMKIEAKVKRHNWLHTRPLMDDPALNGLEESVASEAMISAFEAGNSAEGGAGSVSSAAYILGRDLAGDGAAVRARAKAIVAGLEDSLDAEFPLGDCLGIAVPLLIKYREAFRAAARAQGLFLPAHWPRDEAVPVNEIVARWYGAEISLPTLPAQPTEDADYMIDRLATLA